MDLLRSRRRLLPFSLATATVLLLSGLTAPSTAAASRPDLTVAKGSVRPAGDDAERIKGRFTVRNAGSAPAGASTSYVQAKKGQRWRYVTELRILPLGPRKSAAYAFNTARPAFVALGASYPVRVCLDVRKKVRETREGNNCARLGTLDFELVEHGAVDYDPDAKFFHAFPGGGYYGWVPEGYDDTGATPSALFVWMHGCGGHNEFDIESFHAPPAEDYVTIAPSGREGACWHTPADGPGDEARVVAAIADAAEHFNVDPARIVLGGYSSGGDLAYRTAYLNDQLISAVLAANTSPFRDTGFPQGSIGDVDDKFRVVHLAHTGDDVYPIAQVKSELQVLTGAGFPVTLVERPGSHYDDPGAGGLPGTDADIQTYLLPQVDP